MILIGSGNGCAKPLPAALLPSFHMGYPSGYHTLEIPDWILCIFCHLQFMILARALAMHSGSGKE